MPQVTGTISEGDKILVQDVLMSIRENPPTSPTRGFEGDFVLPAGASMPGVGKRYHLDMSDGRSGDILIKSAGVGSLQASRVRFASSGPFTGAN